MFRARMHVLTLIAPHTAPLTEALARHVAAALPGAQLSWLAEGEAADLFTDTMPDPAAIAAALDGAPVDAIAQPAAGRRKRLLIADMDSTIVTSETLDELAAYAGLKDRIAAITTRSMNGEMDFREALTLRVGLLAGMPLSALDATWQTTEIMPGAAELVATMARARRHLRAGFRRLHLLYQPRGPKTRFSRTSRQYPAG